jgi:inosine-uridine nucleoside N-ribohydrolase
VIIGPTTNAAMLEAARPGALGQPRTVLMGGWIDPPRKGLPCWGPEMDWNIQTDTHAAEIVFSSARLTLVPLPVTLEAHLRALHLPRLRAAGPIGRLLARQAECHAHDHGMAAFAREHVGLPDDLLNFQYDPLACAVAVGWPGAQVTDARLVPHLDDGLLTYRRSPEGRPTQLLTRVDGPGFAEMWLRRIESLGRRG